MINLAWGGYSNGKLPPSALSDPIDAKGHRLERTAAAQFLNMRAACHAATARWINAAPDQGISTCYRDYANQVYAKDQQLHHGGNTAATPGTSNHGWGRAIDITGYESSDGIVWAWLKAYAAEFGYSNATGAATRPAERWHWESLTPAGTIVAGGTSSTLENDMPLDAATQAFFENTINGAVRQAINEITGKPGYGGPNTLSIDGLRQDLAYLHSGAEDSLAAIFAKAGTVTLTDAQIAQLAANLKIDPTALLSAIKAVIPTAEQNGAAARAAIVK